MPNPVTFLKKIPDCTLADGATSGQYDVNNNLYAECEHGAQTAKGDYEATGDDWNVTVRTNYATPVPPSGERLDDSTAIIYGDNWIAVMKGTFGDPVTTTKGQAYANKIATALGGKVAKSESELTMLEQ